MTWLRSRMPWAIALWALLAGGCGDDDRTGPSSDVPASVQLAYSSLGVREGAHYRAALDAIEEELLRTETRCYAVDMDSLIDGMIDSCFVMGSHGMMDHHDMRRMRDMSEWMEDVIGEHRARMDSLATLEEMRSECVEHHEEMFDLLEQVHDALPGRGMVMGPMM